MATKSTEKKTSLEPSEVFCAAGLLIPTSKINELVKDNTGGDLISWAATEGLKAVSNVIRLGMSIVGVSTPEKM